MGVGVLQVWQSRGLQDEFHRVPENGARQRLDARQVAGRLNRINITHQTLSPLHIARRNLARRLRDDRHGQEGVGDVSKLLVITTQAGGHRTDCVTPHDHHS